MKKIMTIPISLFIIINTAFSQDYTNAQLGLPDLIQVAPIAKSATDALPFIGLSSVSTFADTLSYLLSIANTGFKPLEKNISDKHYLQASSVYLTEFKQYEKVITLRFQYDGISFKKSATAQYACEQVADFAKKLAATDSSYKITETKDKTITDFNLWSGKVQLLNWYIYSEKSRLPIFNIAIKSSSFELFADENSYKGKFPTEVLNQYKPQIWEIRGKGKTSDSYQRFNGIFKDGYLIAGSKTFHGYGKFYDGNWTSEEWPNPVYYKRFSVTFTPEGSKDIIVGYFWHGGMGEFEMNADYSHYTAGSPGWVKDIYTPYKANFDQLIAAKRERNAAANSSIPYQQNNTNSTTNNSSSSGRTYTSSFSKCNVCNGKGYTEYDCGQGGGHPCRRYCNNCNGTGQVHN